jgi:hypothetical protein
MLSKTWTNALYILQIGTKTMLVIVAAIIKVQNKRNRKGAANSVAEAPDTTLSISEMVMWYLPVADRLRCFFSNPKDAELMCWWDSYKRKKGDGKLRHPTDARQWKKFDE